MPSVRGRFWIVTINNPVNEDGTVCEDEQGLYALTHRIGEHPMVRFIIGQLERGESGTLHWQGYVELKERMRIGQFRQMDVALSTCHVELRRGTQEEAIAYVTKEESRVVGPLEHGQRANEGRGSGGAMADMKKLIEDGASSVELADFNFAMWCRYNNAFDRYKTLLSAKEKTVSRLHVFWGDAGTGKTWKVMEDHPDCFLLSRGPTGVWWDGYAQQKVVCIDDFGKGWMPFQVFLSLFDTTPKARVVHVKGTVVPFTAEDVYVTSNLDPRDWWPNCDYAPLERRMYECIHLVHGTMCWNKECRRTECAEFRRNELIAEVEANRARVRERSESEEE